ncbi:MAG: hypothetical protein JOZ41_06170 [Chloroflexi bacterium]|nr:hypothetical protein [Chloroflexota bacterium]
MRRICLVAATGLLTFAPLPIGSRVRPALAAGPIAVQNIRFFTGRHLHYNTCAVVGPAQSVFRAAVGRIYALVAYSVWQGRHTDQFRWYSPGGRLYHQSPPTPYTTHGGTTSCNYIRVAGKSAASRLGTWTFADVVDGRVTRRATFRLVR